MATIQWEWTPAIAVGVEIIDSQHQELFKRLNDLMLAFSQGKSKDEVARAIGFLQDYTVDHFGMEERTMTERAYPGQAVHVGQHAEFIREVAGLKARFEADGPSTRLAIEVQQRLGEWLIVHIKRQDREFAAFLKQAS